MDKKKKDYIIYVLVAITFLIIIYAVISSKQIGNLGGTSSGVRDLFSYSDDMPVIYKDKIYFVTYDTRSYTSKLVVSDLDGKNIKTLVNSKDVKNENTGQLTNIGRIDFIVNDKLYFWNMIYVTERLMGQPFRVDINNPKDMQYYFTDVIFSEDLKAINDNNYKIIGSGSNAYTFYKNQIVGVGDSLRTVQDPYVKLYLGDNVIYKSKGWITKLAVYGDYVYIFDSEDTGSSNNNGKIKKISLKTYEVIDSIPLDISPYSMLKYSFNENGVVFAIKRSTDRDKNLAYKIDYNTFKLTKLDDFIGIENNTNVTIYDMYYIDNYIIYCTSSKPIYYGSTDMSYDIFVYDENTKNVKEYKNIYYYQPYEKSMYLINNPDMKIEKINF